MTELPPGVRVAKGALHARDQAILAAGAGLPRPTRPGKAMILELAVVSTRPLSDYAIETGS